MKHTDLYDHYKMLDAIEARELIAAVKAHGDEYVFVHFEDGECDEDEADNAPIIAASTKFMDVFEDFCISRVEVGDNWYRLFGWRKENDWRDEVEIDMVSHGHLSYVTSRIPETDETKDVSTKNLVINIIF